MSRRSIISTQDEELSVLPSLDDQSRVGIYARIGEDGMGYNRSASTTFRLTREQAITMIQQLQAAVVNG